jgi:hypothetical protein
VDLPHPVSLSHTEGQWGDEPVPACGPSEVVKQLSTAIPIACALADALPVDIESYEGAIRRGGLDSGHHGWLDDPEEEPLPGVDPNNFWIALPHQKDFARHAWADMAAGAARLSERVASFRNCLVPWTFVFLLGLLAALLAAGVIAPMFSLSARP